MLENNPTRTYDYDKMFVRMDKAQPRFQHEEKKKKEKGPKDELAKLNKEKANMLKTGVYDNDSKEVGELDKQIKTVKEEIKQEEENESPAIPNNPAHVKGPVYVNMDKARDRWPKNKDLDAVGAADDENGDGDDEDY